MLNFSRHTASLCNLRTFEIDPDILLRDPDNPPLARSASWSAGFARWITMGLTDISAPRSI